MKRVEAISKELEPATVLGKNIENPLERFGEYFHEGEIHNISPDKIPAEVMEYFERKSRQFIDAKDYKPNNFGAFYVVHYADGGKTFIAEQIKTYDTNHDTESLAYLVDVDGETQLGHGELRMNISNPEKFFKDKPFVGYTKTEKTSRRKGFGRRRLLVMNAFSQMRYKLPLYSGTLIEDRAKSVWESLVKEDLAQRIREGRRRRYVFNRNH